jgi:hypothetical protein
MNVRVDGHIFGEILLLFYLFLLFDTSYLGTKYFVFAGHSSWKIGVVQQQMGR